MRHYPLFKVHIPTEEALREIERVFRSGFVNEGTEVVELTERLKKTLRAGQLVLTNSCTSAITMALHLAGVRHGDEVVTTPMTCVATNTPIVTMGAVPVWADVDPRNGMVTADRIEARITPRTRAVVVVAWAGTPPELKPIYDLCKQKKVKLILDAAHAFGSSYHARPVSDWADYTCYSFQAIKHFTTGDGGALVCADPGDHARSKSLKWFGLDRDAIKDKQGNWRGQQWDTDIVEAGYKFNMNNVAAAIGLAQLPHIGKLLEAHRANAALYDEEFAGFALAMAASRPEGSDSAFWVYTMVLEPDARISRNALLANLNERGILAGVVHVPNDSYTAFRHYRKQLPGVGQFAERQFSLPCGWWLGEEDVRFIAAQVRQAVS